MGELAGRVVESLSRQFWDEVVEATGHSPGDFMELVFIPLQREGPTGDELAVAALRHAATEQGRSTFLLHAMFVACAYAVQTMKARSAAEDALAWRHYAEARHWQGVTLTAWHFCKSRSEVANEIVTRAAETIASARRDAARQASSARWSKLDSHKAEALKLANSKPFASRAAAARYVVDNLEKTPNTYYACETIEGWLKGSGWKPSA